MRAAAALALLSLVSCRHRPTSTWTLPPEASVDAASPAKETSKATFTIRAVHTHQKKIEAAPWHVAGGTWTFVDAELANGGRLGIGFEETLSPPSDELYAVLVRQVDAVTHVVLTTNNNDDGAKVVDMLASTFDVKAPLSDWRAPLLPPEEHLATVDDRRPHIDGGPLDGGPAEMMRLTVLLEAFDSTALTLDLAAMRGSLDAGNNPERIVKQLARVLRDGPHPPRSPERDPSVSALGPKPDEGRDFADTHSTLIGLRSNGKRIVYTVYDDRFKRIMEAPIDAPRNASEVARVSASAEHIECSLEGELCVAVELVSGDGGSSEKDGIVWLIDRARRTKTKVVGPWGSHVKVDRSALSPDGVYLALRGRDLYLVPTAGGEPKVVERDQPRVSFSGWIGSGPSLRVLLFAAGAQFGGDTYALDPKTDARTKVDTLTGRPLSPDGVHRVECAENQVWVTQVATGKRRTFDVFEEDRQQGFCARWVSSRFLRYGSERPALLDIETMKLSYLYPPGMKVEEVAVSEDLQWVFRRVDRGLHVSRIVVR